MGTGRTRITKLAAHIVLCVVFIALGLAMKAGFEALREVPEQTASQEAVLRVEVTRAAPEDVLVTITGYGEARALDMLPVTPKVAGEIIEIHPNLEMGEVIPKGGLLFRIDPQDYRILKAQAQAKVDQLTSIIERLQKQYAIDTERMETYRRTKTLAATEFDRDKKLFEEDDIGAESMVNLSEINSNQARDAFEQIQQAIVLYPLRIREAESGLAAAKAQLEQAELSLERTEVYAPFDARVKMVQLELGQNVAPGALVLALANDAVLEISAPLDSRDAAAWLRFKEKEPIGGDADRAGLQWFGEVEPVPCRVSWTESPSRHFWRGTLDRVERFDQMTRTVSVAIRIDRSGAASEPDAFPLVDGMFCQVEIPGKTMSQVHRLPRWAVTFEDEVYLADSLGEDRPARLEKRNVEVARRQGEEAFVSGGLEPGDLVITTRLGNPLPGTLLSVSLGDAPHGTAASLPATATAENGERTPP